MWAEDQSPKTIVACQLETSRSGILVERLKLAELRRSLSASYTVAPSF
jgi:hypothetical protein